MDSPRSFRSTSDLPLPLPRSLSLDEEPSFSLDHISTSTPRRNSRPSFSGRTTDRDRDGEDALRDSDTDSVHDDNPYPQPQPRTRLTRRTLEQISASNPSPSSSAPQPLKPSLAGRLLLSPSMSRDPSVQSSGAGYAPTPSTGSSTLVEKDEYLYRSSSTRSGDKGKAREDATLRVTLGVVEMSPMEEEDDQIPDEFPPEDASSSSPRPRRRTHRDVRAYVESHPPPPPATSTPPPRLHSAPTPPAGTPLAPGAYPLTARKLPSFSRAHPHPSPPTSARTPPKTTPSAGDKIHDVFNRIIHSQASSGDGRRRSSPSSSTLPPPPTPGPSSRAEPPTPHGPGYYNFASSSPQTTRSPVPVKPRVRWEPIQRPQGGRDDDHSGEEASDEDEGEEGSPIRAREEGGRRANETDAKLAAALARIRSDHATERDRRQDEEVEREDVDRDFVEGEEEERYLEVEREDGRRRRERSRDYEGDYDSASSGEQRRLPERSAVAYAMGSYNKDSDSGGEADDPPMQSTPARPSRRLSRPSPPQWAPSPSPPRRPPPQPSPPSRRALAKPFPPAPRPPSAPSPKPVAETPSPLRRPPSPTRSASPELPPSPPYLPSPLPSPEKPSTTRPSLPVHRKPLLRPSPNSHQSSPPSRLHASSSPSSRPAPPDPPPPPPPQPLLLTKPLGASTLSSSARATEEARYADPDASTSHRPTTATGRPLEASTSGSSRRRTSGPSATASFQEQDEREERRRGIDEGQGPSPPRRQPVLEEEDVEEEKGQDVDRDGGEAYERVRDVAREVLSGVRGILGKQREGGGLDQRELPVGDGGGEERRLERLKKESEGRREELRRGYEGLEREGEVGAGRRREVEKKLSLARSEERALAVLVDELRASAQAIGNQVGAQVSTVVKETIETESRRRNNWLPFAILLQLVLLWLMLLFANNRANARFQSFPFDPFYLPLYPPTDVRILPETLKLFAPPNPAQSSSFLGLGFVKGWAGGVVRKAAGWGAVADAAAGAWEHPRAEARRRFVPM